MTTPAETYESKMVPALFAPWVPTLLAAAQPRHGDRVADLATGTGIVARHAARTVGASGSVVGLDMSPAMLDVARSAAARETLAIEFHEGNLESLPFADDEFDLVLCQHGLQFVPDKPKALAEMHRVLRSGGRAAVSMWRGLELHPVFSAFSEAIIRHIGIPALATPFSLNDPDEIRQLFEDAAFENIAIEAKEMETRFPDADGFVALEVDVITAAVPSVQHLDAEARSALVAAVAGDVAAVVKEATEHDEVVMRTHAHIVRAEVA